MTIYFSSSHMVLNLLNLWLTCVEKMM